MLTAPCALPFNDVITHTEGRSSESAYILFYEARKEGGDGGDGGDGRGSVHQTTGDVDVGMGSDGSGGGGGGRGGKMKKSKRGKKSKAKVGSGGSGA
jgi:hypothetical protein